MPLTAGLWISWLAVGAGLITCAAMPATALAQRSTPLQVVHPDGAEGDIFGRAVAVDGDTMIVGAPNHDVGGNEDQGSAHVYRWTGSGWTLETTITNSDGAAGDEFGRAVAIEGDTIIVGAPNAGTGADDGRGFAYVFIRSTAGGVWTQHARLIASDGAPLDRFGTSVAFSGDTVLVGAHWVTVGANYLQGAAYVFARSADGATWPEQARLIAPDGAMDDLFGGAVAISGDTAIVGAHGHRVNGLIHQGAVYVYERTPGGATWEFQTQLTASDGGGGDRFGRSAALSGNTAIVGAYSDGAGVALQRGSSYVFVRSGAAWVEQQKLIPSDAAEGDNSGYSVDISGDTAVVGSYHDDVGANPDQGSAYVFVRSSGSATWTQQAKLTAADGAEDDNFGYAVAVSADTVVVGAYSDDIGARTDQGSAWIFSRFNSTWIGPDLGLVASSGLANDNFGGAVSIAGGSVLVGASGADFGAGINQGFAYVFAGSGAWPQQPRLSAPDAAAEDQYGVCVSTSTNTALVGSHADDVAANADQGSVFVHVAPSTGTTWIRQAQLFASDGLAGDFFGHSVSISGDTAAVGAYLDDVGAVIDQGSAYIFVRAAGGSTWTQQATLTASEGAQSDEFGASVAVSGDTVIVGSPHSDVETRPDQGSAYIFVRQAGGTEWTQQARLTASDGLASDEFGASVAVSGDTAIVGAPHADVGAGIDQGAAYVFVRSPGGTTWTQQAKLTASDGDAFDLFGCAVAISGDTAIAGASHDDVGANTDQGSSYTFVRMGDTWTQQFHLTGSDGAAGDQSGASVSISGHTALVGSPFDDVGTSVDRGSARFFDVPADDFPLAQNVSTGTVYPSLPAAVLSAQPGQQITATLGAWRDIGSLDAAGLSLNLRATGPIRWPYPASLALGAASSIHAAPGESITVYGGLHLPGGGERRIECDMFTLWTQATLAVGSGGTLMLSLGSFDAAITSNTRYDMSLATLQMEGLGAEQSLEVMSTDIGDDPAGLDRSLVGHYPIGVLEIGPSPATVRLVDSRDNDGLGQGSREAVYVDELIIGAGCRLINTPCRVYFRTLTNSGTVDEPGNLIAIAPPIAADFNNDGTSDSQDFFDFLSAFFSGDADVNNDGQTDARDYVEFLNAFFDA